MLFGTYSHNIDAKGRMAMPAKLREELGDKFIVTKGVGKCLFVYSEEEWENFSNKLKDLPLSNAAAQSFARMLFANACECEPDKQGRILLPQRLRDFIGAVKEAVVTGVMNRAEIWSKDGWQAYCDNADEEYEQTMAQLAELGI
ncbi:MAG: division/cell wall cluster transcriptional repressor MraZ [Christensenellaceae bacterium]|jgi:MraZ protein